MWPGRVFQHEFEATKEKQQPINWIPLYYLGEDFYKFAALKIRSQDYKHGRDF